MTTYAPFGSAKLSTDTAPEEAPAEPGLGELAGQGLRSSLLSLRGAGHKIAGTVMGHLGYDGSDQNAASLRDRALAQVEGKDLVPMHDVHDLRSGLRFGAGMLGGAAPTLAAMGGATLLTGGGAVPALVAGTALMAPQEIGDQLHRQDEDPANNFATPGERLASAVPIGVGRAALQNIVPAGAVARLSGGGIRRALTRGAADVAAQGGAMFGSEGLSQVGDNQLNPDAGYSLDKMIEAGKEGLGAGAVFAGVGAAKHLAHAAVSKTAGLPGQAIDAAKGLMPDSVKERLAGAKEAVGMAAGKVMDTAAEADIPTKLSELHAKMKDKAGSIMDKMASGEELVDADHAPEDYAKADQTTLQAATKWAGELADEHLPPEKAAQLKAAMTDLSDRGNQAVVAGLKKGQEAVKDTVAAISRFHAAVTSKADETATGGPKKSMDYSGANKAIGEAVRGALGEDHPALDTPEGRKLLADGLRPFIQDVAAGKPLSSDALTALMDALGPDTTKVLKAVHSAVSGGTKDDKALYRTLNQINDIQKGKQGVVETMQKNLKPELQNAVRPSELQTEAAMLEKWAQDKVKEPAGSEKAKFLDSQVRSALEHRYGDKSDLVMKAVEANVKRERNMIDGESKTAASGESDDAGVEKRSAGEVVGEDPKDKGGREFDAKDEANKDVRYYPENGQLYLNPEHARDDPKYQMHGSPAEQRMKKAQKENPNAVVKFRKASEIGMGDERVQALHASLVNEYHDEHPKGTAAQAKAWADKHIDRFGMVAAESSKQETTITSDELDMMRLAAKKYGNSPSRIDAGDAILDATRMTVFMSKKLKENYVESDDKGGRYRDARMFVEAVAAATDQLGHSFDIADSVQITRGDNPMTWGEAKALLKSDAKSTAGSAKIEDRIARLEARRETMIRDKAEKGIDDLKASGVRLTKANVGRIYEEAREALAAELKPIDDGIFKLRLEHHEDDGAGRQGNDPTGFEGEIERGIDTQRLTSSRKTGDNLKTGEIGEQIPGTSQRGDARQSARSQRLAEIGGELSKLDITKGADRVKSQALYREAETLRAIRDAGLGTGRTEIDPFGPTHDVMRGKDNPDAVIKTNNDGSARGDTVMGRRKPAVSVEGRPSPKALAAKKAAFVEKAHSGDAALLKHLEASDDVRGLQRAVEALKGKKGEGFDKTAATINGRLAELVSAEGVAYGMQTKRYSLMSTEIHKALGRLGFAAAHDSPVKHDGKFDWRKFSGTGEGSGSKGTGSMVKGAGTYLSSGEQAHSYYKKLFTDGGAPSPTYHLSVDIPPEQLMHWDKPLSEQSATVRLRAAKAIKDNGLDVGLADRGEDFYRALSEKLGGDREASDYLQKLGILGHEMRGGKSLDTPNYVIYDDSKIHTNYVHFSQEHADPTNMGPTDRKAVEDHIEKVLGKSVRTEWVNMLHAGEFDRTALGDVVRLSVHALNPTSVAYHESLHGLMARLRDAKQSDIAAVLEKAGQSAPVLNQLKKLLAHEPDALKQLNDSEERAAYMYQFWAQGKLTVGPAIANVFQRIAKFIRNVTGMWTNDERAEKIMAYFHSGEYEQARSDPSAVHRALMESGTNSAIEKLKAMTAPIREIGESLASAGGARLRDTGIPALRELADAMKLKTTSEGGDQGYLPAARAERSRLMNQLGSDLKGISKEDLAAALEAMQTGVKTPAGDARKAQVIVQRRLAQALTYMQDAGVDIKALGMKDGVPYFPRSWDASYISSHQKEFLAMTEKYGPGGTGEWKGDPKTTMNKLMVTDGAEFGVEVDKPGMQNSKKRVLSFVSHADAAPFMHKDLYQIMNGYMTQASRRAEWSRRFGDDGAGIQTLLAKAATQGATPAQLEAANKFVRAVDGTLGDTLDPATRRLMGNMIVYQNIRLLPLAIFSSAVDPQGILVRGGSIGDAFKTFKRGIREMRKNFQNDPTSDGMTELSEAIGTIDSAMLIHTLGASYSQGMVGDRARKWNDTFFRLNMMEQFNASMRVGATEAAMNFLIRHTTKPGAHSARYLRELGLDASDVQLDASGTRPKVLESDGLTPEQSAKMKAAVNRWVDGAILRPDAVDKPVWMSDPHYALIAHLKQFVFSFHETILKRVVHEAQNGNYSPAMAMASYVPVMIAADMLKGMIQGGGSQPSWKDGWGPADYAWSGMERAGLFGVGQFGIDMAEDVQRGGVGIGALAGPTLEQIGDALHVMGGRESFNSFALKSMPANALYASALHGEATDPKFAD